MAREEFDKKLGALLDVLGASNYKHLMIHGCNSTDSGLNFSVRNNELYSFFNLLFCIGDDELFSMKGVHKQDILDMFTNFTVNRIDTLSLLVVDY